MGSTPLATQKQSPTLYRVTLALWLSVASSWLAPAAAAQQDAVRIALDLDNDSTTGCPVELSDPSGTYTFEGAEFTVEFEINSCPDPPETQNARLIACPPPSAPPGTTDLPNQVNAEINQGHSGGDAFLIRIPVELLADPGLVRLAVEATSATGSTDVLRQSGGQPITFDASISGVGLPALGILGFLVLGGLLVVIGRRYASRRVIPLASLLVVALLFTAGAQVDPALGSASWIALFDSTPPLATDDEGSSTNADPAGEITALFALRSDGDLLLRVDLADVEGFSDQCNQFGPACGALCDANSTCGDSVCDPLEDCATCDWDCGACGGGETLHVSVAGDGIHDGSNEANALSWTEARTYSVAHTDETLTFLLAPGSYGRYWESVGDYLGAVGIEQQVINRAGWHTWKGNDLNDRPLFTSIRIHQPKESFDGVSCRLIFDGLAVKTPMPEQPALPPWELSIWPISLVGADYVQVRSTRVEGALNHVTDVGLYLKGCDHATVSNSDISVAGVGMNAFFNNSLRVINNHFHDMASHGGIRLQGGHELESSLIEGNEIHAFVQDQSAPYFPPDKAYLDNTVYDQQTGHPFILGEEVEQTDSFGRYTRATIANVEWTQHDWCGAVGASCYIMYLDMITPTEQWTALDEPFQTSQSQVSFVPVLRGGGFHTGSGFSVRISNVTIRKNTVHDFPGQGIMSYAAAGPYENIVFEHNVFYDYGTYNMFREVNGPLVVRDNTLIGRVANQDLNQFNIPGRYQGTPFSIGYWPGFDGAGVVVERNVVVGPYSLPDPDDEAVNQYQENYNFWWSGYAQSSQTQGSQSFVAVYLDESNALRGNPNFLEDTGYVGSTPEYSFYQDGVEPAFVDPGFHTGAVGDYVDNGKLWDYRPLMFSNLCDGSLPGATTGVAWAGALECVPCEEGAIISCHTGLLGACSAGTRTCNAAGVYDSACVQTVSQSVEVCDDAAIVDEDCDGIPNCADPDCAPDPVCEGKEGLVLYLPFNGNAADYSGFDNSGLWIGEESYEPGVSGQAATLIPSKVVKVEGLSGVLTTGSDPDFSVAMWVRPNQTSNHALFRFYVNGPFIRYSNNLLRYCASGSKCVTGTTPASPGQWQHVVVTYDNDAYRWYVDGNLDGTLGAAWANWDLSNLDEDYLFYVGDTIDNYPFDGGVDEVLVFNRALTEAEIQSLFNQE